MMIKRRWLWGLLLAVLVAAPAAGAPAGANADVDQVLVRLQVWRVRGDINGDMSLTDNIFDGKQLPPKTAKTLSIFTTTKMRLAGHAFEAKGEVWKLDGKPVPIKASAEDAAPLKPGLELISQPSVLVEYGTEAKIQIGSVQALEYFVRRADGAYDLKKLDAPTGMTIQIKIARDPDGRAHLDPMTFSFRTVQSRRPVEGTTLDVGEPVVSAWEQTLDLHLAMNRDYGMLLFPGNGQGALLMRVRVEPGPKPAAASPTPTPKPAPAAEAK